MSANFSLMIFSLEVFIINSTILVYPTLTDNSDTSTTISYIQSVASMFVPNTLECVLLYIGVPLEYMLFGKACEVIADCILKIICILILTKIYDCLRPCFIKLWNIFEAKFPRYIYRCKNCCKRKEKKRSSSLENSLIEEKEDTESAIIHAEENKAQLGIEGIKNENQKLGIIFFRIFVIVLSVDFSNVFLNLGNILSCQYQNLNGVGYNMADLSVECDEEEYTLAKEAIWCGVAFYGVLYLIPLGIQIFKSKKLYYNHIFRNNYGGLVNGLRESKLCGMQLFGVMLLSFRIGTILILAIYGAGQ